MTEQSKFRNRMIFLYILMTFSAAGARARAAPSNEELYQALPAPEAVCADHFNDFLHSDFDDDADYRVLEVGGQPFTEALEVAVHRLPASEQRVNLTLVSQEPLQDDEILLLSFYARRVDAANGQASFLLQHNGDPWTQYVSWRVDIGNEWRRYYLPFSIQVWRGMGAERPVPPPMDGDAHTFGRGEVRFRLCLGSTVQTLQFADVHLANYRQQVSGTEFPITLEPGAGMISVPPENEFSAGPAWIPDILGRSVNEDPYLPDFSYAGFAFGEIWPPVIDPGETSLTVTAFGAVPDDGLDDTIALQNALTAAHGVSGPVCVAFPPGKFHIREILFVRRSHMRLKGAGSGPEGTILAVTRPMADMIRPPMIREMEEAIREENLTTGYGEPYSPFSWTGGVIWLGRNSAGPGEAVLTETLGTGLRGAHAVGVGDASRLTPGMIVGLRYYDDSPGNPLREHVFGCTSLDLPMGFGEELPEEPEVWQYLTVDSVQEQEVRFKEPLNHDIQSGWRGELRESHFLTHLGVDSLCIEFPEAVYAGHHIEAGYNAIYTNAVAHAWISNVRIVNSDSAIIVDSSKNVTVQEIGISGRDGHYSLMAADSDQILFRDFTISARACHNPSFNTYSRTCVYSGGNVCWPMLDQHCGMNHQNLMEDLVLTGPARQLWTHGGSESRRPAHGAGNTFWNLRLEPANSLPVVAPGIGDGPNAIFVGWRTRAELLFPYGPFAHAEGMGRADMAVPSLHDYQLSGRLGGNHDCSADGDKDADVDGFDLWYLIQKGGNQCLPDLALSFGR
ncbi:MAG: glycosyl hydrolase family 28-related protein [Thermodesulfobacteriota bacterium]